MHLRPGIKTLSTCRELGMELDYLKAHGLSSRVIDNWKRHYTSTLLPLQAEVVSRTSLLAGNSNLIVFAPTSSGKTFVAEIAALKHIQNARRALFLVPTKALAEEQYARFHKVYSPLGLKVCVATRERTRHDTQILAGNFDMAVMVYEKFKAFLASAPQLLARLGIIAIDELQLLGDCERGTVVDLLLAKVLASGKPVQLLGLSAVVGENARLSHWLKSDFFVWRERPVELREGVFRLNDGVFVYREANSKAEGEEKLLEGNEPEAQGCEESPQRYTTRQSAIAPDPEHFHFGAVEALTQELASRGEQVLVFVPTRQMSRQWAFQLAQSLPLERADQALEELESHEPSHSRQLLEQCFERSVAFHNADLPHDLRTLVEQEFNAGALRVLVATATLAQGVNLTGRNVINVPVMVGNDVLTGSPAFVPISRQRLRNQGGRAGRFSSGETFGRSILVAEDEWEAQQMMRELVFADVEALEPPATRHSLQAMVLDLVQSGIATDIERLKELLLGTYAGMTGWGAFPHRFQADVEESLEQLEKAQLIQRRANGRLVPTGIGQASAAYGISVATSLEFADYCRALGSRVPLELELIMLCAFSSDAELFPLPVNAGELSAQKYPQLLSQRRDFRAEDMGESLRQKLHPEGGFNERGHSALKKAFLAEAWISDLPTAEIEEKYRVFAGTIANLGAHLCWLAQALGAIASNLGVNQESVEAIDQLAARLSDGVQPEGADLSQLGVRGLTRMHIAALIQEGFDTPQAVAEASEALLSHTLPPRLATQLHAAALDHVERQKQRESAHSWFSPMAPGEEKSAASAQQQTTSHELVIDTNNAGRVVFRGRELSLTELPFRLLVLLARWPQRTITYAEIDATLWPDTQVEQQQIHQHKSVVLRALSQVCRTETAAKILSTINGQGLRLELPPEKVCVK